MILWTAAAVSIVSTKAYADSDHLSCSLVCGFHAHSWVTQAIFPRALGCILGGFKKTIFEDN